MKVPFTEYIIGGIKGMNEFNNVISLGHLCATASELERIGLRAYSGPFDWCETHELERIINLIQNNFQDYLNSDYLYQDPTKKFVYTNIKYNVVMNHDFNQYHSLSSQLPDVNKKYQRRIKHFYKQISEPTLFIRDISSVKDLKYIEGNQVHINKVLQSYNRNNEVIYVSRNGLESRTIKLYQVKTKINSEGNETFFKTNKELFTYLDNGINYPKEKRNRNYGVFANKKNLSFIRKKVNVFIDKYRSHFQRKYHHNNQQAYDHNHDKSKI